MHSPIHIILLPLAALVAAVGALQCHCFPFTTCWPTSQDWKALNASIGGNLVAVVPVASPCHDPNYNAAACAVVQANTHSSAYRSDQPGALQWENWEASSDGDDTCYVESPRSTPCKQGRVSLYSAQVETAAHIQAVVAFATKHNVKLAIKNTGHDFLGRSSAPSSLQLSTHKLKSVAVVNSFVPSGAKIPGVKAITLGAGVQQHDLYGQLGAQGVMAVMGSANTVGAAGGYIQGGGHSLMGWIAGMASDNALEFNVVAANGTLVTANAYQHSDLFFALRGGGGGTWGVVVSVTVKAYPDYPVSFTLTNFTLPSADASFWSGVEAFHRYLVPLNDAGGTGYYYITPISPVAGGSVATFTLQMWFVNQTDGAAIQARFASLLTDLEAATGTTPAFQLIQFPTMSSMYTTFFTGSDYDGLLVQLGSRLISRSFAQSGAASIASALSKITLGPTDYIEGNVVAGGKVAANRGVDSAVNPAWRDTVVHMLFTRQWSASTSVNDQQAIKANITNTQVPILKSLEPGKMGAYLNEADANEPQFQQSFWGSNYKKLAAVKAAWDPSGVFIARRGVGSEAWTDDGLCHF